jgi:hypothetical protein
LVDSNIGPESCLFLRKSARTKISTINLGNNILIKARNKIGDEGCNYLAKAEWDLTHIYLCTIYLNQQQTVLDSIELNNHQRAVGPNQINYTWEIKD